MKNNIIGATILAIILLASVSALTISSVTTSPESVAPGQDFSLKVELENNLDDDISDVQVSLNLQNIPISPEKTTEAFVEDIEEDDSEKISFSLSADASAEAGSYKIPVQFSYKIGNQTITKSTFVSVTVTGDANLQITSDSVLLENQKNKMQIQITNSGLGAAKFLSVQIGSGNYDVLSSNTFYIGDLDSDDFNTASFDLFVKKSGQLSIPLTLTYRDAENNLQTESRMLSIRAYSAEEAQALGLSSKSNTLTYLIVIVALVAIWLIYRKIKKKRKMSGR